MWTMDNTADFTQSQLDLINEVLAEMIGDGYDESNASDIINNVWTEAIHTADDLRNAVKRSQDLHRVRA